VYSEVRLTAVVDALRAQHMSAVPQMPAHLKEMLQQFVFPVVAISGNGLWHNCGSGFVIVSADRRALLFSAAHVFDIPRELDEPIPPYHLSSLFRPVIKQKEMKRTQLRAVCRTSDNALHLAVIDRVWMLDPLDIAVCLIQLPPSAPPEAKFRLRLGIDTKPLTNGEPVLAVGYHSMTVQQDTQEGIGASTGQFNFTLEVRDGVVTDVFPSKGPRNEPMSCFQANVAFDSGMSGGPVIKKTHLPELVACGIIGKDSSDSTEGQQGSGTLALAWALWQAMALTVELEEASGSSGVTSLLELVKRHLIDDRGDAASHVRITSQPQSDSISIAWHH
jgi:Trypsin-like peptidase domain